MAKVKLNPIIEQLRGQVGDLVFKRHGHDVVISRKPDQDGRVPSEAQLAQRERFRQAVLYGKMVIADPETRVIYENAAKIKGKPAFALMVADFCSAPSVDEVDVSEYTGALGDRIMIRAHDDIEVVEVNVTLTDGDGDMIESGEAVETPVSSGRWFYTTTATAPTGTTVRIGVTAVDRPGGRGEAQVEKAL
jgi:hypothetical protein